MAKSMRPRSIEKTERQLRARDIVLEWFRSRGWTPFDFQRKAWYVYLAGKSGLIHAPTGIGKTYAAWFGALMEWMVAVQPYSGMSQAEARPFLRVLWVTPLRALAKDLHAALLEVIQDLEIPWSVECRTGDTPAAMRKRQKENLPTALITTPESLNLLLSYPGAREKFNDLCLVVVDEWHELMGSKRGVLVEVASARLKSWNQRMKIWGLSATMGNTGTAMETLLGDAAVHGCLIRGLEAKSLVVESIVPRQMERFPWAGHLGLKLLPQVIEKITSAESTLVFTNTRSQAEIWYQAIITARPDWEGRFALHHGSLNRTRTRHDGTWFAKWAAKRSRLHFEP